MKIHRPIALLLVGAFYLGLPVFAAEPQVVEVKLDSYSISPNEITVKVNKPVTLKITNAASFVPHNLIINAPEAGIDIKVDVSAGKTGGVTFTPTRAGRYEIHCDKKLPFFPSHKDKGMHGTLIVK